MFTDGKVFLLVIFFRTTVKRGYKFARPPGGREEHPVTNCTNACNERQGLAYYCMPS